MYTLWLSDIIFSMRFTRGDSDILTEDTIHAAYTEWEHAELRLQGEASIYDRKDSLSALNRAVLHRVKILNETYRFRGIPGIDKTLKNTEILHVLGLARGSVLDLIRRLRNQVEHDLNEPPDRELCDSYLDAAWYFLRSTDHLLAQIPKYMHVSDPGSGKEIADIFMSPPEWKVYIEGDVASAPVSFLQDANANSCRAYPIELHRILEKEENTSAYRARARKDAGYLFYDQAEHSIFFGEIQDTDCIRQLAKKYLSILH